MPGHGGGKVMQLTSFRRAIVLSAGQGKRLLPLTESRPKCLIDLAGRSVLAWQLTHLAAAGVRQAVVVTGFAADLVDEEIARLKLPGLEVSALYNPFYGVADNLASCWIARDAFDGETLLLNGDTLFEPEIAARLVSAPETDIVVTIDRKSSYDADDMKVATEGTRLAAIGKTLETYDAESIGFLRFSAAGAARFRREMDTRMRDPVNLKRFYLSVIDELARQGGVSVQSIEGLDWGEMDFPKDVEANRTMTERWAARARDAA